MIARLRGRLAESGGYTLSEMIAVLAILGVVLAALVQVFTSGSHAQVDQTNRFRAQQNGRLSLDKLRREIHCTSAAANGTDGTALAASPAVYSSVQFTLPSYCPTNPTFASATPVTAYATWCTALVSSGRYQLWRYVTTTAATFVPTCGNNVTGATKVLWADYLTQANAFGYVAPQGGSTWASSTAYTVGQLVRPTNTTATPYLFKVTTAGTSTGTEPTWPTTLNATVTSGATFQNIGPLTFGLGQLSVDLPVDLTPADTAQLYDLKDNIVLRNTTR